MSNRKSWNMGWILSLFALIPFVLFLRQLGPISQGSSLIWSVPWIPSLGINLSFYLDGLSLLFALIISGVGFFITIYSGDYLAGHRQLGRFYLYLLLFMFSMLGVVLANNVFTMFVFWELTSITSYLLIGFEHREEKSRAAALQALLTTGLGGLSLLAGLIFLTHITGEVTFSVMHHTGDFVKAHSFYPVMLLLVLGGAFTKSAQFPFHFWLPSAMAAPTPVSAYLHSATMVNAGIYLLARLSPTLGGTDLWFYSVTSIGMITMLLGAFISFREYHLKRILAFSTIAILGLLTMLMGVGSEIAIRATMVYLLVHALYKATLFLVAGCIQHETDETDIRHLSGLIGRMPRTAIAAVLAALSMAGLPPLFGFIGKELVYEAAWYSHFGSFILVVASVLASIFMVAVAGLVGIFPFFKKRVAWKEKHIHEASFGMTLGPLVFSIAGVALGLFPWLISDRIVTPSVMAVLGESVHTKLALWHGVNPALFLEGITLLVGIYILFSRTQVLQATSFLTALSQWGPARGYEGIVSGMNAVARKLTRTLQHGYLRYYVLTIVLFTVALALLSQLRWGTFSWPHRVSNIIFYEAILCSVILLGAFWAVRFKSRLAAIISLGFVGYGIALIFVLFGAPDLAITQFVVETLTVILFVLVLLHLPRYEMLSHNPNRVRDCLISLLFGGVISLLVLVALDVQLFPSISNYYSQNSLVLAHGRNIVNVIIVDFRGLDTLGEITVLATAGVGVFSLLKLRPKVGRRQ